MGKSEGNPLLSLASLDRKGGRGLEASGRGAFPCDVFWVRKV